MESLPTNCGSYKPKKSDYLIGLIFIAIVLVIFLIVFSVVAVVYALAEENERTRYLVLLGIVTLILIALSVGLALCVKYDKEQMNSWPIKREENDLCKQFQNYKYESGQAIVINNVNSIDLPENKVIRQLVITGKTMDLVVTRKKDNLVLKIPLDVTELKNGTMQCNYDAIFTSDLYTFKLNFDGPCDVTYAYTDIIPGHSTYIKDYRIVARQCESVLMYIADDHKSSDTATVYCFNT